MGWWDQYLAGRRQRRAASAARVHALLHVRYRLTAHLSDGGEVTSYADPVGHPGSGIYWKPASELAREIAEEWTTHGIWRGTHLIAPACVVSVDVVEMMPNGPLETGFAREET